MKWLGQRLAEAETEITHDPGLKILFSSQVTCKVVTNRNLAIEITMCGFVDLMIRILKFIGVSQKRPPRSKARYWSRKFLFVRIFDGNLQCDWLILGQLIYNKNIQVTGMGPREKVDPKHCNHKAKDPTF